MSLYARFELIDHDGFPRVSGDEPNLPQEARARLEFSPREWG